MCNQIGAAVPENKIKQLVKPRKIIFNGHEGETIMKYAYISVSSLYLEKHAYIYKLSCRSANIRQTTTKELTKMVISTITLLNTIVIQKLTT